MTIERLAKLFQKAEDAFLGGAYGEAINNYNKIIEIDSASFEAYERLAIAYTKANQLDKAIAVLEKSISLCAGDSSVYNNLGVLYFKKSMYFDAKTYFEIALLLNPDYKEARQNLGKVEESIKNASHAKITNLTFGLIFSKDRAMQLDATLRSFYLHCSDVRLIDLKVIYKTSNEVNEKQYEDLKKEYVDVLFVKEDDFKEQVLSIIRRCTYILFLVDDNIFLRNFSISDLTNNLNENKNAIGFSLRLGANTVYCYALHSSQTLPNFTMVTSDILKYDWTSAERDFGYPLEVSSSLYRIKDIYPLLVQIHFRNPNTLEDQLAANKHIYVKTRPNLLCGKLSLTFCAPLNVVQDVCDNRAGSDNCYTSNTLSKKFGEGYRISIENYTNFTPNACHQEVPLDFIKSKP